MKSAMNWYSPDFRVVVLSKLTSLCFLMAFMSFCCCKTSHAYVLADTGQTSCYNDAQEIPCPQKGQDFYGQDGNFPGVSQSYTDNKNGTVTDTITGLLWQQTDSPSSLTWAEGLAACQGLGLGGYADWRMPSRKELLSIVNIQNYQHTVDPVFQFNLSAMPTWSSTAYAGYADSAWTVDYYFAEAAFGPVYAGRNSVYAPVRCVRGAALPDSVYVDNGDGTVLDQASGLVWEKAGSASDMTWKQALAWCENQRTAGKSDWRLPNKLELETLVDVSRVAPAIDPVFTESGHSYWTGSTDAGYVSGAWHINFGQGGFENSQPKIFTYHARCVRGGLTPPVTSILENLPSVLPKNQTAHVTVTGSGLRAYKYRIDDAAWSEAIDVTEPITLAGLSVGKHVLFVVGQNNSGDWQSTATPTTASVTVVEGCSQSMLLLLLP